MAIKKNSLLSFATLERNAPKLMKFRDSKDDLAEKLKARYYKNEGEIDAANLEVRNAQSFDPETDAKYRSGHSGNSSLVEDISYDPDTEDLTVRYRPSFYNGSTVVYEKVDRQTAEDFMKAASKGRFAVEEIWKYKWHR